MTDAAYSASRAALWTGATVLITDADGRILVERVAYRQVHLLPGGALDAHEAPLPAAVRELREELGVQTSLSRGLVVDWVPTTPRFDPALHFPGEIIYVYDGGTWSADQVAAIRLPAHEVLEIAFVEPARLPALMEPGDARRALAALRARINTAGTVLLEDGYPTAPTPLDRLQVLRTPRKPQRWPWHTGCVPAALPVVQSWGWLFAPDGRILILIGSDTGSACLPGGTLKPADRGDPAATLRRKAHEEAALRIGDPLTLGYLHDNTTNTPTAPGPCARVRMAACLTHVGPSRCDQATGQTYARLLATPEQATELFDWGSEAAGQLAAVHTARERLGLPRAPRQAITELPHDGGSL
ncbi:NUDIX domain-containing protein [Streptomyces sp. NPDC050619]|uniref:NUDIX hydrolase n=1 Tax=Streptomyces sp. NPDC050619 TaxID=3157214 RepID=UPI003414DA79